MTGQKKLSVYYGGGLTEENCQCDMVYALRIREATPGEGGVFMPDRGDGVDMDRYEYSTAQFESADPYNRIRELQDPSRSAVR